MRVLHLANIANMAYAYAKTIRTQEIASAHEHEVLCYDMKHILSIPESHDGTLMPHMKEGEFIKDEYFYSKENVPKWYQRIMSADYFKDLYVISDDCLLSNQWCDFLIKYSKKYGDNFTLTEDDIFNYRISANILGNFFVKDYDIVFGYAYAPAPMLLQATVPYVPIEIGTMREIPFTDTALGRLLAMSYRTAPHVIITNPDTISAARALDIERYTFIPHPLDEEVWKPKQKTYCLHEKYNADFIFFAPARQNWDIKGNDKYIKAMKKLKDFGFNFKLIIPIWGQDIKQTEALIKALSLDQYIDLIEPMNENKLIEYYHEADCVLDQFGEHKTFGLIAPKAMACGAPVCIAFDEAMHQWCFSQMPPFLNAYTTDEIYEALKSCMLNKEKFLELGSLSRQWIEKHHSKEIIASKFNAVIEEVIGIKSLKNTTFHSLRQKRLEIEHGKKYSKVYDQTYHEAQAYKLMDEDIRDFILDNTKHLLKPKILDLGCGPGSMIPFLNLIPNSIIVGVDLSIDMVNLAQSKHPDITFIQGDAENLDFEDESFDIVLCSGVLHHFNNLNAVLHEINRVLKKEGLLFCREPNETNFSALFPKIAFAHSCLNNIINIQNNSNQFIEPAPHDYHIAFDYKQFLYQLAEIFEVQKFVSGAKISYLYTYLKDDEYRTPLMSLEDSLAELPGLNILCMAQKSNKPELSCKVVSQIQKMEARLFSPYNHFDSLLKFSDIFLSSDKIKVSNFFSKYKLDNFISHIENDKHNPFLYAVENVKFPEPTWPRLITSVYKNLKNKLIKRLDKDLTSFANEVYTFNDSFDEVQSNHFGNAFILIESQMNLKKLIEVFKKIKDYGVVNIKINKNALFPSPSESEKQYLSQMIILDQTADAHYEHMVVSRFVFTPRDFYMAFDVAMNDYQCAKVNEIKNTVKERIAQLCPTLSCIYRLGSFVEFLELRSATLDNI